MTYEQSMRMAMKMGGPSGDVIQRMSLSPPIANSIEEARSIGSSRKVEKSSSLDEAGLNHIRSYLSSHPRAVNRDLIDYLAGSGYSVNTTDINLARSLLETE
ncbi:MAG: hypothetical protein AABW79_00430 [Nanoarchaeota archaeon]